LFVRLFPPVSWASVEKAIGRQDTVRGLARVYLSDGSEWEYALWAKIEGPGQTVANGMVRPIGGPPRRGALPGKPHPELIALGQATDIAGARGIIRQLVASGGRYALGRRVEWRGRAALMVEAATPHRQSGRPSAWRFVLDPQSKLVVSASMLAQEGGRTDLRVRCDYQYNLALPPGFRGGTAKDD
jgi:hypothetical protein